MVADLLVRFSYDSYYPFVKVMDILGLLTLLYSLLWGALKAIQIGRHFSFKKMSHVALLLNMFGCVGNFLSFELIMYLHFIYGYSMVEGLRMFSPRTAFRWVAILASFLLMIHFSVLGRIMFYLVSLLADQGLTYGYKDAELAPVIALALGLIVAVASWVAASSLILGSW